MEPIRSDALKLEIYNRLKWFILLRWGAIGGITGSIILFKLIFDLNLFSLTLACIILAMIVYNLIFSKLVQSMHQRERKTETVSFSPFRFANLQIGLDLLFLMIIWHLFGGVENPIMFFFIFHMIIASILLTSFNSLLWAILSSAILSGIAFLEYHGIIDHHTVLSHITGVTLWNNLYWIIFTLTAFCFSLICVVLMTSTIAARLRRRNKEIINLEKTVSQQKLQDTEKKLVFSEKMASLGKLAAGIAHEINNPLTTILSYSECLCDEIEDNKPLYDDVQTIISETIRIREIVKDILNFARAGEQTDPSEVDINQEVMDTVKMLQPQMNFIDIVFDLFLQDGMPLVTIGKEHLKQVIINILVNASQAMNGKGMILIHTYIDRINHTAIIRIKDSGPGIPQDLINKIFDPYFTTKKQGEGTGLGLSVSYGLIKMYGGDIRVESKVGKGAAFILRLPLIPVMETIENKESSITN